MKGNLGKKVRIDPGKKESVSRRTIAKAMEWKDPDHPIECLCYDEKYKGCFRIEPTFVHLEGQRNQKRTRKGQSIPEKFVIRPNTTAQTFFPFAVNQR